MLQPKVQLERIMAGIEGGNSITLVIGMRWNWLIGQYALVGLDGRAGIGL